MSQTPAKKQSLGNFLSMPNTQRFLEDNLKEKKSSFVSNLLALTNDNELLAQCDPNKLMRVAMNATVLNLPLVKGLGYAYVIPYYNNKLKCYEPEFQIGAKGFKQLAMRSGQYKIINHCEIRKGELTVNKFTNKFEFHGEKPENDIVGYFAYFELLNGYSKCLYMSNDNLEVHALRYSQSYQSDKRKGTKRSKWSIPDERPAMCEKTVLKLLLSRDGILSPEMEIALQNDTDYEGENHSNVRDISNLQHEEPKKQDDPDQPEKIKI